MVGNDSKDDKKSLLRVGLVDDDVMTLAAMRSIINVQLGGFGVNVIWALKDGNAAVECCIDQRSRPQVVLIDMNMDHIDGSQVCRRIRLFSPTIVVYAMTAHTLGRYTAIARDSGAQALFDKSDVTTWKQCLLDCAAGHIYIAPGFHPSNQQVVKVRSAQRNSPFDLLTEKETEVLNLSAEELTAKEVAERMALTESTVKTHIRHAIDKLGARNKLDLIRMWMLRHLR